MNKKFWYLTKLSFNKKVKSKWFIVTNVILLIAIVALLNISSIIEFFGGDFENNTNIIVIDNANAYQLFEENLNVYAEDENFEVSTANDDIDSILVDLQIETYLKEDIAKIMFGKDTISHKRIAIRKLKKRGLSKEYIQLFLRLLEYISEF